MGGLDRTFSWIVVYVNATLGWVWKMSSCMVRPMVRVKVPLRDSIDGSTRRKALLLERVRVVGQA
jgi:hypothetical protein